MGSGHRCGGRDEVFKSSPHRGLQRPTPPQPGQDSESSWWTRGNHCHGSYLSVTKAPTVTRRKQSNREKQPEVRDNDRNELCAGRPLL